MGNWLEARKDGKVETLLLPFPLHQERLMTKSHNLGFHAHRFPATESTSQMPGSLLDHQTSCKIKSRGWKNTSVLRTSDGIFCPKTSAWIEPYMNP